MSTVSPYIITRTGIKFYFDNPKPEMISLVDIAYSLSRTPRFLGHTVRFYSVAEHSIRVAHEVQKRHQDPSLVVQALLHDAEEAYVGDLVAPLKFMIRQRHGDLWEKAIAPVRKAIAAKFKFPETVDIRIDEIDKEMAATEGAFLVHKWDPFNLPDPIEGMTIAPETEKVDVEAYFNQIADAFLNTYLQTRDTLC